MAEILVPVYSVFNRLLAAQHQEVQVHCHPPLPQCAFIDPSSPSNDLFTSEPASPLPVLSNISTTKRSTNKLQLECPEYTIYADAEIISGSKAGSISTEVRHRLIRGTMHNMIASCAPFNGLPYVSEIEKMAKSLLITYPCLRDVETGHVSNIC